MKNFNDTPRTRKAFISTAVATLLSIATPAWAQLKIGVLATLEGALSAPGQDGVRGVDMAVEDG